MDYTTFISLASILTFFYIIIKRRSGKTARLPPGPYPFPIIGSIFKLGENPHVSLASLSKSYGPLMSLKMGSTITVVASSPEVAKEFFLEHDLSFSSRAVPDAVRTINHHLSSMVWLPVGDKWRRLRRISKEHLFTVQQLDAGKLLQKEKIQKLLDYVDACSVNNKPVNIGRAAFTTTPNILSNFIFSTDMAYYETLESREFEDAICALTDLAGKPNFADYFPILKPFDLQGLLRTGNIYAQKLWNIYNSMVDQRVQERAKSSDGALFRKGDVLDLLLDLSHKIESKFSRDDIVHLFFDLFVGATDTTTSTLEWEMAELLHNPEKMAKVSELQEIIDKDNVIVEESDISKIPYLNAVVKETLRLHPPVPFLLPHKALCDVEIKGFTLPKDAQILRNAWAIGRDPSILSEPQLFMPERFLDINIDYKDRDFELIPFGSGRRMCPGLPLAHRMLHLMLGSLICKFDWKLEEGMKPEDMDMNEKFGITLHKNAHLVAIPVKI